MCEIEIIYKLPDFFKYPSVLSVDVLSGSDTRFLEIFKGKMVKSLISKHSKGNF